MRKGQAAMEFLMTYGWAILVVLAAIGALAYFGVLSPKNILPSSCTVGAGFGCKDAKATSTTFQLNLLNNLGSDISGIVVNFEGDIGDGACDLAVTGAPAAYTAVPSTNCAAGAKCNAVYANTSAGILRAGKSIGTFTFSGCTSQTGGNKVSDFTIEYILAGETLTHTVQGKANLKVEQ